MSIMNYCVLICFLLLISCFEDKGNYDYIDLNTVIIEGIHTDEWYEKTANVDTLCINPSLRLSLDSTDCLEYEWLLIPLSASYNKDSILISEQRASYVIGREKNLVYPVAGKAGEYAGFFCVRNILSGITYKADFYLRIKTAVSEGWMILCEENGEARLDMIAYQSSTSEIVSRDIWRECGFSLGKPYKLTYNFNITKSDRLVWCEKGTYALDCETLWPSEENDLALQFIEQPEKIEVACGGVPMCATPPRELLITSEGELYTREVDAIALGSFFDFPKNRVKGEYEYFKLSPWVGFRQYYSWPSTSAILFYDENNRRFLSLESDAELLSEVSFSSNGNVNFSSTTGRDMVYMEGNREGYVFAVLKEPDLEEYYLYGVSLQVDCKVQCSYYVKLLPANTDKIIHFAFHPLYRILYYATEQGDVYQFNMNTPNMKAKKILSFPGEQIAVMKFNYPVPYILYEDWENTRWNWLHIGSNVKTGPENECGIVRMYNIPESTSAPLPVLKFDRFGKIVDMVYRFRKDEVI